jgi:outer membrane protein assembly factor BamB
MPFCLVALCLCSPADWPQFRGPNADGIVKDEPSPLEWSDTKNVAWKVAIAGLGWSSPTVVGDRVFLTTATKNGDGLSLRALALDAKRGSVVWDREVFSVAKAPTIHPKNSHASPTPIVDGDFIYVHFGPHGTAKLSAVDGSEQWRCTELDYPPVHGGGGSPILHAGKLFVVCDGSSNPFVAAVNADTGKVAWKTLRSETGKQNHSFVTPTVTTVEGKGRLLAPGPQHMAAYDVETGAEVWKVRAPGWSVVPQPAVGHGMVFYNHDYDNPELMAVKLGGQGDVTDSHVVWRMKRGAPSTPSPLLLGEELYFVNDKGFASCVNARSGERYWMERLGGTYSASPIFVNDRILFLSEDGEATWVKPGRKFEVLGKNTVPGRTLATPAFSEGAMYLRTDTHLYKVAE